MLVPEIDREKLNEKPHKHNFHEIIYINHGEGKHTIDDKIYDLKSQTFYLISKGQVHEFLEGSNLKGYLLRFQDNFLPPMIVNSKNPLNSTLLGNIISKSELSIPKPEVKYYEYILEQLYYEFELNERNYAKEHIIQHLLLTLLIKLDRRIKSLSAEQVGLTTDRDKKTYQSFLLLIEEYYKTHHEIKHYIQLLHIDKRKFSNICKRFSGKTPKQLLNERILLEAKRMLKFTFNSSKEISFELGFEDPAYFSRFFKKHVGLSPRPYKLSKSQYAK